MLHTVDPLRRSGLRKDRGRSGCGVKLAQGSFMTVIWFILRDYDNIGFGDLREI